MKKSLVLMSLFFVLASSFAFAGERSPNQRSLLAFLKVRPGAQAQFLKAAEDVIYESRKEPGNLVYVLQESVDDPQLFVFYELFKTDADLEWHRKSKHVVDFLNRVTPILIPGHFKLVKFANVNSF